VKLLSVLAFLGVGDDQLLRLLGLKIQQPSLAKQVQQTDGGRCPAPAAPAVPPTPSSPLP